MALPTENNSAACEQCGAPFPSSAWEEGCLNCLLSTGIEGESTELLFYPNEPNTRHYQHYEILSRPDGTLWELGRGAMGVTYKARDVNLDTTVALKVINARFSARPNARRLFLREARAAAQLRHPNVASVFHFGTVNSLPSSGNLESPEGDSDAGDCFYAMEFVEGESLEARLRRAGPLPPVPALAMAVQVARALAAAEKRGLVHRDLKPSNIMLASDEEAIAADAPSVSASETWAKVIDFGLAKLTDEESAPPRFLGTLAFASPEQRAAREVDVRSDIYSLGVTLWYSLTGRLPFGRMLAEDRAQRTSAPLPLAQLVERDVPPPLIALLASMLASEPDDRPRTAVELSHSLQRCLHGLAEARRIQELPSRGRARRWALAGGLSLAASLVALAIYLVPPSPQDKSVAVLPFRNLSTDPANAFFAEGVQDDILSRLVKIHDLKVISRLGTARYPADAPRDLGAIGRALGVRHLLEGSLRRDGDRVRLHVSLVDTRDGHEVWSEAYDRNLADAISLQGALAREIADALNATLSPRERMDVQAKSTHSPDAYLLYLQGRQLENSPTFAISGYEAANVLYTQAVTLDPGFALAHARLASTLGLLYRFRGPSDDLKDRAHAEVNQALRLQPGLGEAHLANGLCYYRLERDFARALPELEIARRLIPNDTEAASYMAYIDRRRGRWREARASLAEALSRDPLNRTYEEELHATACLLRDWPTAADHVSRALALAPKIDPLKGERALVDFWQSGNLAPLQRFFADFTAYGDPEGNVAWSRWDCAMLSRNFAVAHAAIDGFPFETLPSVLSAPVPKAYLEGCTWLAQGQDAKALKAFNVARPAMEAEILPHPGNALRHARLGLLYAYIGRKADAIREGERAVQLTPVTKDAIDGHQWLCNLALIYARVGDANQAISMIERLLREPGCISPLTEASMSQSELRLRWQWDPLRNNPRFQKILAGPEPQTVF
jgi:serine/threonine protein kinase/tetratricopeptide (TPR) repeat protein